MASENRQSAYALIEQLEQAAERFDFFAALRLIDAINQDKPMLGTGIKASDDAVRLGQDPELQFMGSSLSSYTPQDSGKPRLAVNFFGLFGPHGALPLHLTEYARERMRFHHDATFVRFADIFHQRMLCLFYRAWANSRPTVAYDRPASDRFAFYTGALMGIGGPAFRDRDALHDHGKLFYVGHLASQTKCPDNLQAMITEVLGIRVLIQEFVGEWMRIDPSEHSSLGLSPRVATLGQSVILGSSVWGCQHKFRMLLGPLTLSQYESLLPGALGLTLLTAIVRNYVGDELVWDANLVLKQNEVPAELALGAPPRPTKTSMNGTARLGWTTWLGPRPSRRDANDLILKRSI